MSLEKFTFSSFLPALFALLLPASFNCWSLSGAPPHIIFEFENKKHILSPASFSNLHARLSPEFLEDLKDYLDVLQSEPLPNTKGLNKVDYFFNQWHPKPDWTWGDWEVSYKKNYELSQYYQPNNALEVLFSLFILYQKELDAYQKCLSTGCRYAVGASARTAGNLSITPIYGRKYIFFGPLVQIGAIGNPNYHSRGWRLYEFPEKIPYLEDVIVKKFPEISFYKADELRKSREFFRFISLIKNAMETVYKEKLSNREIKGFRLIQPSFMEISMKTGIL